MDVHDGSDGQPRVFHKKTLVNKILFEDILIEVKKSAFKQSKYFILKIFKNLFAMVYIKFNLVFL